MVSFDASVVRLFLTTLKGYIVSHKIPYTPKIFVYSSFTRTLLSSSCVNWTEAPPNSTLYFIINIHILVALQPWSFVMNKYAQNGQQLHTPTERKHIEMSFSTMSTIVYIALIGMGIRHVSRNQNVAIPWSDFRVSFKFTMVISLMSDTKHQLHRLIWYTVKIWYDLFS